ncbi:MAG: N-acetylglucosamine-6-phosphate deacetylase, partial [Actinobacteria bacterium]|nr:N-acetylglucosamine-6-phosphate deacetylase [Actinomycetota bacterium]
MSVGSGEILVPGLVDLQINGAYGHDFSSDPRSMWRVGARLPEQGVTAFLPTIITSRPEMIT